MAHHIIKQHKVSGQTYADDITLYFTTSFTLHNTYYRLVVIHTVYDIARLILLLPVTTHCGLKVPDTLYKVLNYLAPGLISYMFFSYELVGPLSSCVEG